MSTQCNPRRCLLDKNLIRYILTGLYYGRTRPLTSLEVSALTFWRIAEERGDALFISHYTFNVLQYLKPYAIAQIVLDAMPVLSPTRYHSRWTRRVRESAGLTREDAAMVALASFGSNDAGDLLGVHWLVTCDQSLCNGYRAALPFLERRFRAMKVQLPSPFCDATLPKLAASDELLTAL